MPNPKTSYFEPNTAHHPTLESMIVLVQNASMETFIGKFRETEIEVRAKPAKVAESQRLTGPG